MCTEVFMRMVRHTTVCLTTRMCAPSESTFVRSLVVCVFRSQSLVEVVTLLIGSGRSDPLGPAPHPTRQCPCLVDRPQWGSLLHPHSTHTPEHRHKFNVVVYRVLRHMFDLTRLCAFKLQHLKRDLVFMKYRNYF